MSRRRRGSTRRPPPGPRPAPGTGTTAVPSARPRPRNAAQPRRSIVPLVAVVGAVAVAAVAFVLLARPFGGSPGASPSGSATAGQGTGCPTSQPPPLAAGDQRDVAIATSQGSVTIRVHGDWSPIAAGNFIALASCDYYEGVTFHRLVPGFVIQGGDPDGTGRGGPGYTIADEPVTQTYRRGLVAMARTPAPNSQGSQFFVILDDDARSSLDAAGNYAIFGEVTAGMDTVDRIAAMPNSGPPNNTALEPVAMDSVTVTTP